jgi:hypothetical protein
VPHTRQGHAVQTLAGLPCHPPRECMHSRGQLGLRAAGAEHQLPRAVDDAARARVPAPALRVLRVLVLLRPGAAACYRRVGCGLHQVRCVWWLRKFCFNPFVGVTPGSRIFTPNFIVFSNDRRQMG